jgi:cytochrome c biogenesis protein CcmG/thiol:disulfide interchange protein DsbE
MQLRSATRGAILLAALAFASIGCDRGDKPSQIGKPAPVFVLNDGQRSVDLSKLRGHVVILNFWATWCAPCIEEMPSLELLQKEMPQVQILAVASTEDFTEYETYLSRRPVSLLSVYDAQQTSNALYGSFRFPETYIIDKSGIVRRKLIGPQDFTSPDFVNYLKKLAS